MIRSLMQLVPAQQRHRVTGYMSLAVLSVLARAVGTVLLVPLLAALFGPSPKDALPWLAALSAVTIATWWVDMIVARIGFDLGFAVLDGTQHEIADRLTHIRLDWLTAENTAIARQAIATSGVEVISLIINLLTPLINAILLPVGIAAALFFVAWQLGVAAALAIPVMLLALWGVSRLTRRADAVAAESNSALTERIIEFARTQQALRASRRVEPMRSHVGDALKGQHGAMMRLLGFQVPGQIMFSIAANIALIALAGTTTLLAMDGRLSVPEAIALIVVMARHLESFTVIGDLAPAIENIKGTLDKIRTVLTAPTPTTGSNDRVDVTAAPSICFDNVGFGYGPDGEKVLPGVGFTLEPGTTTAIVGPSGSGKSTVLGLMAGLLQPDSGRVLVDGVDAADLDHRAHRDLVSMVFQTPYLFDGSIRDNVQAGDPEADEDAVARACTLAQVDEITHRLPDGIHSRVAEGGAAVSGGERQRIGIARALLKPAPILLVDEATSALDTENESAVVAALTGDPRPRTRVIVAHRLASIRAADRVLFLEEGVIVQDGTVDELLATEGRFSEFWQQQHERAAWRLGTENVIDRATEGS